MLMEYNTDSAHLPPRAGVQFRSNEPRIFHVKGVGWFVRTRGNTMRQQGYQSEDGLAGPFPAELNAQLFVDKYLRGD